MDTSTLNDSASMDLSTNRDVLDNLEYNTQASTMYYVQNESFPLFSAPNTSLYNTSGSENVSTTENVTIFCTNEYCVNDEEYLDMILEYLFPAPFEWCLIVAYAVVFVVGLVGNFLVCFSVWRNKSMRTVTNYFIVNLAIADFLVVLICLPTTVLEDIGQTWFMGRVGCKIVKYLQAVTVTVSILTLSCISVERYYAICQPLKFKATTSRTRTLIVLTWAVAITITLPELVALDTFGNKPSFSVLLTSCRSTWSQSRQTGYQVFQLIATYILPFCLMFLFYTMIARSLWSTRIPTETSRDQLNPDSVGRSVPVSQLLSRRKVAKMLISVVVMFGICYLPVHLLNILRYSGLLRLWPDTVITTSALLAHWMCYFNSAINPVIYNFMSTKFRREFRNACVCVSGCRGEDQRAVNHSRIMHSYRYTNVLNNHSNIKGPNSDIQRPRAQHTVKL